MERNILSIISTCKPTKISILIYFLFPLSWKFSTYFRLDSSSQIRLATFQYSTAIPD